MFFTRPVSAVYVIDCDDLPPLAELVGAGCEKIVCWSSALDGVLDMPFKEPGIWVVFQDGAYQRIDT